MISVQTRTRVLQSWTSHVLDPSPIGRRKLCKPLHRAWPAHSMQGLRVPIRWTGRSQKGATDVAQGCFHRPPPLANFAVHPRLRPNTVAISRIDPPRADRPSTHPRRYPKADCTDRTRLQRSESRITAPAPDSSGGTRTASPSPTSAPHCHSRPSHVWQDPAAARSSTRAAHRSGSPGSARQTRSTAALYHLLPHQHQLRRAGPRHADAVRSPTGTRLSSRKRQRALPQHVSVGLIEADFHGTRHIKWSGRSPEQRPHKQRSPSFRDRSNTFQNFEVPGRNGGYPPRWPGS
jgi:hypothetical protein